MRNLYTCNLYLCWLVYLSSADIIVLSLFLGLPLLLPRPPVVHTLPTKNSCAATDWENWAAPTKLERTVRDICVCLYIPICIRALLHILHVHILGFQPLLLNTELISSYQERLLNRAGRLALVTSVLSSMQTHHLTIFSTSSLGVEENWQITPLLHLERGRPCERRAQFGKLTNR
jgi:hypothetical protein